MSDGRKRLKSKHPSEVKSPHLVTAYLDPAKYERIYYLSEMLGRSMADVIRMALDDMHFKHIELVESYRQRMKSNEQIKVPSARQASRDERSS